MALGEGHYNLPNKKKELSSALDNLRNSTTLGAELLVDPELGLPRQLNR